jgi:type III secretory pathway component EscT
MVELLEQITNAWGGAAFVLAWIRGAVLAFARIAPLTVVAPWFAMRSAPALVRTAVTVALTAAMLPMAGPFGAVAGSADALRATPMSVLVLEESLIGAVFALATSVPFFALDWAGRLIDTWRGASLAEVIAPPTGERTSPLGDAYLLFGIAVFVALGGHVLALRALAESFVTVPVGHGETWAGIEALGLRSARVAGAALTLSWMFAAPVALVLLLAELGFGLLGRAAPQIPLFFAAMPARAALGVGVACLTVPALLHRLPADFEGAIVFSRELLLIFAPR